MRPIPPKLRKSLADDPYYSRCARRDEGTCRGRITWEHCFTFAGKQINELWAIIPLCWHHHLGAGLDKDYNRFIALNRATDSELAKYPKVKWQQLRQYLHKQFVL